MTIGKINVSDTLERVKALMREDRSGSDSMRAMIELLVVVITLLLDKLGVNSSNSSIPPSKDPTRRRGGKKTAKEGKRKPGGQNGHKGTTLQKEANPDQVERIKVDRRAIPPGQYITVGFEARQVIEIEVTRNVVEYQAEIVQDAKGKKFVAEFPEGVTRPVQYGASVKAQSVYMSQQQLVPYERVCDYFSDQCGIPVSPGTLFNFNKEAFKRLEEFESIAKLQLGAKPLLHADETGINVNGKLHWLHTVSDAQWTLFFPHTKRGGSAIAAMGILGSFEGTLCHDHWKPYFQIACRHSLCNAHHLRELERAATQDGQRWAKKMQNLLLDINAETIKAGGSLDEKTAKAFVRRYRNVLTRGEHECPEPARTSSDSKTGRLPKTKSRNLLERLRSFEAETLRFMTDPLVPFTNNQSENDIRMTKVQQKVSGCFRSLEGAQIFCRVRSYLITCKKHGIAATEALKSLFSDNLPDFIRPP